MGDVSAPVEPQPDGGQGSVATPVATVTEAPQTAAGPETLEQVEREDAAPAAGAMPAGTITGDPQQRHVEAMNEDSFWGRLRERIRWLFSKK